MTYVIYTDYQAGKHPVGYEYKAIEAKSEFDAVAEAEKMWNAKSDDIYLMRIMAKSGKFENMGDGWKKQKYEAVLCKRSTRGWHRNIESEYENPQTTSRWYRSGDACTWFE